MGLYQVEEFEYKKEDKYFICSDGLWEMISGEKVECLIKAGNYQELLEKALKKGGKDNISFIIIE